MASPVIVIGAGAAGLIAAITAAGAGRDVLVLERTRDGGRKILISGGGRCNVLPAALEPHRFVTDSSPHTLRNLLRSWPLEAQRRFFEEDVGIPLKLEEETRKLFPQSDRARDVRDGLLRLAGRRGVQFAFGASVEDLRPHENGSGWRLALADGRRLDADRVIVATGGLSVPQTGSDGTGLALLERLGHRVHPPYPALTPLLANPPVHAALSGVSLTVTIRVRVPGRAGGSRPAARGGFLFTHRGYSGPAVLDVSHHVTRLHAGNSRPELEVAWSDRGEADWHAALQGGDGLVLTRLRTVLPDRLASALLAEAGIPRERMVASLRREERHALVARLCRHALPWTGHEGYRKAEVTGGGVALDQVDPRTLESRVAPGLFLCGELLDAFGPIGGHNFAWAWATGRLAGLGAARDRI